MPPRHALATAKTGYADNSGSYKGEDVFFSAVAPPQPQAPQHSAAPRVAGSRVIISKRPPCPNRHTVAHAAAALPLLRELRAALSRVAAADAALAAAIVVPGSVLFDAADAVDAAVDLNTRVIRADAADAADALDACVRARCCPSYTLL